MKTAGVGGIRSYYYKTSTGDCVMTYRLKGISLARFFGQRFMSSYNVEYVFEFTGVTAVRV